MTYSLAVIGGTGPQNTGVAYRFSIAGDTVTGGLHTVERAEAIADEIT